MSAEVKLARRILQKHALTPPIDVKSLVELYADLVFKSFPIEGIDGIAIDIKVPGKRPLIVINSSVSTTRQRFTMAHELAHLVIPWHIGIKFDNAQIQSEEEQAYTEYKYASLESEANAFAAELLMPGEFLREIANNNVDLATTHREVCRILQVSPEAAAIKLGQSLPPGVLYCAVRNGVVQHSARTEATAASQPSWGVPLPADLYPSFQESRWSVSSIDFHWWQANIVEPSEDHEDDREWRTLLNEILSDLFPESEIRTYKNRISGIIGSANGKLLRNREDYSLSNLYNYCYVRFDEPELRIMKGHSNFDSFLKKRIREVMSR